MSKKYSQLTDEERIEMYAMKQAGKSSQQIAAALGRHRSTIYREVRRNTGQRGYRPKQAHQQALQRRHQAGQAVKMTRETMSYIAEKIRWDYSPEQIAATMKADPDFSGWPVSHERIYQYLWQNKRDGGWLYKHLRIASGQKNRKRYGKRDSRGKIPNRKGIEQRPPIVETKTRLGDWEADLVVGTGRIGYLVTLSERVSRRTLVGYVRQKKAEWVTEEIIRLLQLHPEKVHTITFDNGLEFAGHETIAAALNCQCYFARPYHSWERGLNENTNGLIRQYFPKKQPLGHVSQKKLDFVMNRLNNRPRKILGFKTPNEVYSEKLKSAA
jgi:IS30 family transposase